jgi:peptidoglycan hydrolase CwlO-like protein
MKGKKLMMTAVLAFFGFVLLAFSVYLLYKNTSTSKSANKQKELDEAIKQIEVLNAEIVQKDKLVEETEQKIKSLKSESMSVMGQNMPIIEIVDNDLSEENNVEEKGSKKVHKLMYHHQIRFFLLNAGRNSLKDVIFSVKDDYNRNKEKKKKATASTNIDYTGKKVDNDELGVYENIEVNTLNLKSKKLIYTSNLPGSFGVADYEYHLIVEWSQGFYQMLVKIEELNGKLKYNYEFFDVDGKPIDFKNMDTRLAN